MLIVNIGFVSWALIMGAAVVPAGAQDSGHAVINVENVTRLGSAGRIEFEGIPKKVGKFHTGWFAIDETATSLLVVNHEGALVLLNDTGEVYDLDSVIRTKDGFPTNFIDGAFNDDGSIYVSVHYDSDSYYISYVLRQVAQDDFSITSKNVPVSVWVTGKRAWVEVVSNAPAEAPFVLRMPLRFGEEEYKDEYEESDLLKIVNAAATDPTAVTRIGRIPPPYAVTSTQEGLVKLWNLETGEVVHQAKIAGLPVFGQIDASATHLAWRDTESKALHLLDFTTGKDTIVAPLNGEYIQFMFLTQNADVILGVNNDLKPNVVAWDVKTGKRTDLGEYRTCSRVPDMVRLSKDGTTLVIGCDTGLDVWRVKS